MIKHKSKTHISKSHNKHKIKKRKTLKHNFNDKIFISDVIDDITYNHFKSLLPESKNLCKGKTKTGNRYKVHISLHRDFNTLQKNNHYKILYVHDNKQIIAYISVKLYKTDGGFMFIHKVCSNGGGYGTKLMNMILEDAKQNYEKLGITYLSLTTHNLDLVDYYNQFNPTRIVEINNPGSKSKKQKKVAYMIWQLSPNMPYLEYK
jgi:hypothetical protein